MYEHSQATMAITIRKLTSFVQFCKV